MSSSSQVVTMGFGELKIFVGLQVFTSWYCGALKVCKQYLKPLVLFGARGCASGNFQIDSQTVDDRNLA